MGVYIQLLKRKQIAIRGKPTAFETGDCVEVGIGYARRLVADGEARILDDKFKVLLPGRSGVLTRPGHEQTVGTALGVFGKGIPVQAGAWDSIPFSKTLLWDAGNPLRLEFLPVGFNLLTRWQLAIPLLSYDTLACSIGEDADRALTAEIVHDLRVLAYNPRILFIRRCPEMKAFLLVWEEEGKRGNSAELALLRALYRSKPLLLALPPEWGRPA